MKKYDVIIIGAGTAGLSARKEVANKTDNYLVVDDGPLGTTCARVGCMPSKALIQVANDFHRRKKFNQMGIKGEGSLSIDSAEVMTHVRSLRDRFVRAVKNPMEDWKDHLVQKKAMLIDPFTIDLDGEKVKADKIIIAVGSRPKLPEPWLEFKDFLIDTDQFFELRKLPEKLAVIGLGVIGIELGQALSRLGVEVFGTARGKGIGGLTDPKIQDYVTKKFSEEFPIYFGDTDLLGIGTDGRLKVKIQDTIHEVDKVFLAVGRQNNLDKIGFKNLGVAVNKFGNPDIDPNTMRVIALPHIFIPGDANGQRPILHEAADEGAIAGHNAVNPDVCFKRRVPLGITFSEPSIAFVGKKFAELNEAKTNFVIGEVSFEGQGRSIVKLKEQGLLHIYADSVSGEILGAELQAPDGEHLAHLLAWVISMKITVFEALKMPFYHPVTEEGLRTALRKCALKIKPEKKLELFRCFDPPIR